MQGNTRCIECGGAVVVSYSTATDRTEECLECGRKSRWHVCLGCGEVNGPRRVICLECGLPFDRSAENQRAMLISGVTKRNHSRSVRLTSRT